MDVAIGGLQFGSKVTRFAREDFDLRLCTSASPAVQLLVSTDGLLCRSTRDPSREPCGESSALPAESVNGLGRIMTTGMRLRGVTFLGLYDPSDTARGEHFTSLCSPNKGVVLNLPTVSVTRDEDTGRTSPPCTRRWSLGRHVLRCHSKSDSRVAP